MTASVLFYVQHLLGIGHLQRSLRIAAALIQHGVAVTLVSGGPPTALVRPAGLQVVQLPPIRARDARFELEDQTGAPVAEALRARRRAMLLDLLAAVRPGALVIEGFPFARRTFGFELDPLLAAARRLRPRPLIICSVRDIVVVHDDPVRQRAIVDRVRQGFDAVMVHADPVLVPFEASFPLAAEIADRLTYTGYVTAAPDAPEPAAGVDGTDEVIVSAGGGAAGLALLQAAIAARSGGCMPQSPWRLLTGTHLPEDAAAALQRAAPEGMIVERFRDDLPARLRRCRVSVSQAGYNTVLEIIAARARAVLVPFTAERETEQLLRAERLAALGVVELVRETELSPQRLALAIERAASRPPPELSVDMSGAVRSARIIAAMLHQPGGSPPRCPPLS